MAGGTLIQGSPSAIATSVSTDTRSIPEAALFIALVGERFDAHTFLAQAAGAGAAVLMVSAEPEVGFPDNVGIIKVEDTLLGLQSLARAHRKLLASRGLAITGSSGKTSTKDMALSVLSSRFQSRATAGNFNNHIGLPLTLLAMEEGDEAGVWEMGMSNPGEIAVLAEIANPDVAIVTNVGTAHIEFMGSREAIADEKGSLPAYLDESGTAILCAEDDFTPQIAELVKGTVLTGGFAETADIRATDLEATENGTKFTLTYQNETAEAYLPVAGEHMVQNATLAVASGIAFGIPLADSAAALANLNLTSGRLTPVTAAGLRFLDDSYNANPDSTCAALRTLSQLPVPENGRRIAVLGDMAELGDSAEAAHREVGEFAAGCGIDILLAVGAGPSSMENSGVAQTILLEDTAAAADWLAGAATQSDLILLKGSRSAKMEAVISQLSAT